jgi:hypothetical protein
MSPKLIAATVASLVFVSFTAVAATKVTTTPFPATVSIYNAMPCNTYSIDKNRNNCYSDILAKGEAAYLSYAKNNKAEIESQFGTSIMGPLYSMSTENTAIVLHYFEQKTLGENGVSLAHKEVLFHCDINPDGDCKITSSEEIQLDIDS